MALSSTRYGNPAGGPALDTGMGLELSMRDPTVLIGALVPTWPGTEGGAAFAGCEASARQSTTIAVRPHFRMRICTLPFPQVRARSNADRWPVKCGRARLMAGRHRLGLLESCNG